jgi:hypothetical protein
MLRNPINARVIFTGRNLAVVQDKKKLVNRVVRFSKFLYLKTVRINDLPHKIAMGFALGSFLGVLPFTGVVAALILAVIFKVIVRVPC